jgi:hypothetical protein
VNSSVVVMTQSNFDDNFSRKSFIQSFSNAPNHNHLNSSRESSLKSFNSGGTPMLKPQNANGMNKSLPFSDGSSELLSHKGQLSKSSQNAANINKEEKKALVNHNALISRFHNYVN